MGLMDHKSSGEDKVTYPDNGSVDNGELVEFIILKVGLPRWHIKDIKKINLTEKENAESMGEEPKIHSANYKAGGLNVEIAVLKRHVELANGLVDDYEKIWHENEGELKGPEYIVTTNFSQLIPEDIFNATSKAGMKYGNMYRKGGDTIGINGKPNIIGTFADSPGLLPSAEALKDDDRNIEWKYRVSADNIPQGQEGAFILLIERDNKRLTEWEEYINEWNEELSEEDRKSWLETQIARRMLLCHENKDTPNEFDYIKPQKGLRGFASIYKKEDSFYFNLNAFGFYDKAIKAIPIYSTCDVHDPSDVDIKMASMISKSLDIARKEFNKKKKEENKETDKDGLPF